MTLLDDTDLADGVYDGEVLWEGMIRNPPTALTAAGIPVKPPAAWFTNPGFTSLEPLTVTADGQITGHIASWREDHIGMNGRVKAPRSKSGYAFFATGCLETAEGTMVNVGQITLTGGHAPLEASVAEAVAHYDNTDSAFADVAVGEDKHGIWVAGALRPTVDDNQLRAIRASSVSGDWRPINGSLEMVAVCAVNVPGFPIPRARVASGVPVALVAAGTGELVDLMLHQDNGAFDMASTAFDDRLRFIENVVLGRISDNREAITAAVDAARQAYDEAPDVDAVEREARIVALRASVHGDDDREARMAALRASVHGPDLAAALRASVHGPQVWADGMDIDLSLDDCTQVTLRASLKARVHPDDQTLVARATSHWNAQKREAAAGRGTAMKDGSFPISDREDLGKAIKALGRAKNAAAAKRHIMKRARALGAEGMLPDDWRK